MRDFMDTMRSSGLDTGGPSPLSEGDRKAFANALDRHLARLQLAICLPIDGVGYISQCVLSGENREYGVPAPLI
jgi:hypothetical protein